MDYGGKMETFHTVCLNSLIKKAVPDAIDEEDNASHIVYIKGLQKRDWLADL